MRLVTALAVVLLFTGTAAANIVTNPSLKLGSYTGPNIDTAPAGSTDITGWIIGPFEQAGDGAMSLDLSGLTPGSVFQTLTTVAGQLCNVSFLMAGNPDDAIIIKTWILAVGAGARHSFNFDATGASVASMLWATKTTSFVASGL